MGSTHLRGGCDRVGFGTRFTNRNSDGELVWATHADVVRLEPGREIAFRIEENWAIWSSTVAPQHSGVQLVQRREAPDGVSDLSLELTNAFMGGVEAVTASMCSDMRLTLERIKAEAES